MDNRQSLVREAIVAGIIGATSVAIWFLILDTMAGRPFHTPRVLAAAFFGMLGAHPGSTAQVVIYTVLHYIAFAFLGASAATLIRASQREQNLVAGLVVLFVAFEGAFYGVTALTRSELLASLAWWKVGVANLIAAGLMGLYMLRVHPELRAPVAFTPETVEAVD